MREYQIQFVATLQYSSPEAFTEDLRISYRKGVILAVGGMDPETDYVRVHLTVALTSTGRRRLLQAATLDVSTWTTRRRWLPCRPRWTAPPWQRQ